MEKLAEHSGGLSAAEAREHLERYGPNEIVREEKTSRLRVFARQFKSPLILMLVAAAGIAGALGEVIDAVAIALVVLLNGVLGYVQEWRTETALAALRGMLTETARVRRDGHVIEIDSREVVPGDLVVIEAGDKVPADLKLSSAMQLKADESVLTGESLPVGKDASEENGALFMGTSIVLGRGEGVVTFTGAATRFGRIAELTGSVGQKTTHLQSQLGGLAKKLGLFATAVGILIMLVGLLAGRDALEIFMTSLALAVAVVPEGLPAVVTITLALGASAMLRQKALVRRLQAVETLGSASVICTDKTGTLTENAMSATAIWIAGRDYTVTGTGYAPVGQIEFGGQPAGADDDPALAALLDVAALCNHAELRSAGDGWEMIGDPTEGALLTLAAKGGMAVDAPVSVLSEIPFSSERKRMSVIVSTPGGARQLVKGAPEAVLAACATHRSPEGLRDLSEADRAPIEARYSEMADQGLRVLGFAQRSTSGPVEDETELEFLGLVGLIDPPRPEVKGAVALCRSAGVRVVMITGDAPRTGGAIARAIGLPVARVLTGAELAALDDHGLRDVLREDTHFARTTPAQKMRIIDALQDQGQLVAMTGDGVNDAPALRKADIGVSMGQRGTDVAKDASDLVLLDDNFATIVRAIREGRRQFANIQKFVRYLLSSNFGEVIAIVANILIGGPLIFFATQILWMNLVTDGVTAVALGLEKSSPQAMQRPPRPKSTPILDRTGICMIGAFGLYTGGASLWLFYSVAAEDEALARTLAFTGMVVFEKLSVFAFRSFSTPCWRLGWLSNRALIVALGATLALQVAAVYAPPMQALLHTKPLSLADWGLILGLAAPLVIVPEVIKSMRAPGTVIRPEPRVDEA